MSSPGRPARAVLALVTVIVIGLGVGAYLVNVPLLWVAVGEVVALTGIAFGVTRTKQTQPVTSETSDGFSEP
jgi:hypothetical protein